MSVPHFKTGKSFSHLELAGSLAGVEACFVWRGAFARHALRWLLYLIFCLHQAGVGQMLQSPLDLAEIYTRDVDKALTVPVPQARRYAELMSNALAETGLSNLPDQYLVLVDRSPQVQAIFVFWKPQQGEGQLIGASPVSTGRPGRYDYFETPTGVFSHSLANPDFRAEGTRNGKGIRGYGEKGMRIFDFGWQQASRGWGDRRRSLMRLQMHATDPDLLEPRLGRAQSKGCIRIPAALNRLLDVHGVLDADYEQALLAGKRLWMLHPQRQATPWSGRYLVVIDSLAQTRPEWAVLPLQGR